VHKLSRETALRAIRAAGAVNDQRAFLRLYTENRISLPVAKAAFQEGKRFAAAIHARDAAK
jgi:hypothetical protein